MKITVAARNSPLSKAQVEEVMQLLRSHKIEAEIDPIFVETYGDIDQKTSLRSLEKTDFFTREVDQLLLSHQARIGIHSAKDLPEPLADGLKIVALTKGVDSADVLVLRPNETLQTLNSLIIATSSTRREQAVRELCPDKQIQFIDLRGTIHQRLALLDRGEADGIVVAEAALIRLNLTSLNRIRLPGSTTSGQGQLALLARKEDHPMRQLFAPLDCRSSLYLGLEIAKKYQNRLIEHHPIIQIYPREIFDWPDLKSFTHLIFTSKTTVELFFSHYKTSAHLEEIELIAIGEATARSIQDQGRQATAVANKESAEGLVELLSGLLSPDSNLLWPHSARSRSVLKDFFVEQKIRFQELILYDTHKNPAFVQPELADYAEIIFTSPSTVDAFLECYGSFPTHPWLTSIGPITGEHQRSLEKKQRLSAPLTGK